MTHQEIRAADYLAGSYPVTLTVGAVDTVNNRVPVTAACLNPVDTANPATDEPISVVDWGGSPLQCVGSVLNHLQHTVVRCDGLVG